MTTYGMRYHEYSPPYILPPLPHWNSPRTLSPSLSLYARQAVDQLVQCLTDDKYKGNLVVVAAGYSRDIDELMEANPGLASRFPETLHFPNFLVDDCCRMLEAGLRRDFSTELAPDAAESLGELLTPLVEVWLLVVIPRQNGIVHSRMGKFEATKNQFAKHSSSTINIILLYTHWDVQAVV